MLKGEKELRKALGDGRADDFLMVWFMLRKLDPGTDKILEVLQVLFPELEDKGLRAKIYMIGG